MSQMDATSQLEVTTTRIAAHYYYYYYYYAHQHKAAGRKTRLDIQNYGCNGNLLCDHGVEERNRISSMQSHGKALEKECCLRDGHGLGPSMGWVGLG